MQDIETTNSNIPGMEQLTAANLQEFVPPPLEVTDMRVDAMTTLALTKELETPFGVELMTPFAPNPSKLKEEGVGYTLPTARTCLVWNPHTKSYVRLPD